MIVRFAHGAVPCSRTRPFQRGIQAVDVVPKAAILATMETHILDTYVVAKRIRPSEAPTPSMQFTGRMSARSRITFANVQRPDSVTLDALDATSIRFADGLDSWGSASLLVEQQSLNDRSDPEILFS